MSDTKQQQTTYDIFLNALKIFGIAVATVVAAGISGGTALIVGGCVGGTYLLAKGAEKITKQHDEQPTQIALRTAQPEQVPSHTAKSLNKTAPRARKIFAPKPHDLLLLSFNEFIKDAQNSQMEQVTASASMQVAHTPFSTPKLTAAAA